MRLQRLLWLDKKTASEGGVLTEQAKRLLQMHAGRNGDPEQHIDAPHSRYLLCQDTYFVGTINGVGKVYMQTVVDAHCSQAFAKVSLSKMPITAADTLHDRVIPFYEKERVNIERLLTDNGREYCGLEARHPFEIYLAINQIRHKRTQVASPQTNGFRERFHRTIQEEFYSVKFRQKIYQLSGLLQSP
ncbi:MAG: IS481 family transposase, partial [Acidobacteriota bacterium]